MAGRETRSGGDAFRHREPQDEAPFDSQCRPDQDLSRHSVIKRGNMFEPIKRNAKQPSQLDRRAFLAGAAAVSVVPLIQPELAAAQAASSGTKPEIGDFGLDLSAIDPTINPGDDFFRYTNGGWLKANVIPTDRAAWGGPMAETTQARMREIMTSAGSAGTADGAKTDFVLEVK